MKITKNIIAGLSVLLLQTVSAQSEFTSNSNAIFWEVSGKNLEQPSYVFGTFHLVGNEFIDSNAVILEKFNTCKTVAGELVIDSTMVPKMMAASVMTETTLDKLLPKDVYDSTAAWMKELSGYDLAMFNNMNPMAVELTLSAFFQQQNFPMLEGSMPMDAYFQTLGAAENKTVLGLETMDDQIEVIYGQYSLERQAELLADFIHRKAEMSTMMIQLNEAYDNQSLGSIAEIMYNDDTYTEGEIDVLLKDRNDRWMKQLTSLMQKQPVFIAVGALHLPGKGGLVQQLLDKGYTVTPILF